MPTRNPPTASLRSSRWRQAPQSADSARSPLRDLTVASSSARCLQASYGRDRSWSVLVGLEPAGVLGVLVALGRPAAAWRLPAPRRALAGREVVVALWARDLQLLGQVRTVIPTARLPAGVGSEVVVAAGASPEHERRCFGSSSLAQDPHGTPPRLDHSAISGSPPGHPRPCGPPLSGLPAACRRVTRSSGSLSAAPMARGPVLVWAMVPRLPRREAPPCHQAEREAGWPAPR